MVEKTADVAETAGKLVGAWDLVWAEQDRDGRKSEHYGKDPLGQIIYSADGRMAALLASVHWLEAGVAVPARFGDCTCYAGTYDVVGEVVRHHVQISNWPRAVGVVLERNFEFIGRDRILLRTLPVQSSTAEKIVQTLLWKRVH